MNNKLAQMFEYLLSASSDSIGNIELRYLANADAEIRRMEQCLRDFGYFSAVAMVAALLRRHGEEVVCKIENDLCSMEQLRGRHTEDFGDAEKSTVGGVVSSP